MLLILPAHSIISQHFHPFLRWRTCTLQILTHSHTHTHTHTHKYSFCLILSLSFTLFISLALTHPLSHTHSCTLTQSVTYAQQSHPLFLVSLFLFSRFGCNQCVCVCVCVCVVCESPLTKIALDTEGIFRVCGKQSAILMLRLSLHLQTVDPYLTNDRLDFEDGNHTLPPNSPHVVCHIIVKTSWHG